MPEPITTTIIVGALIWAFAEKAVGKVGEKATESLWEKCKLVLRDDEIITLFPRASDSALIQNELKTKLDEKLRADIAAQGELEQCFNELPQPVKDDLIKIWGDNNQVFQNINKSTITKNTSNIQGIGNTTLQGSSSVSYVQNIFHQSATVNQIQSTQRDEFDEKNDYVDEEKLLEDIKRQLAEHDKQEDDANEKIKKAQEAIVLIKDVKNTLKQIEQYLEGKRNGRGE